MKIVEIFCLAPGDVVGQDAQIAVVVVGVFDSLGVVLVADGGRAPIAVVAVGDVVTIAVVGACQPMTGVVGVGMADQRAAADLDAVHKVKCAVGERIVRAGSAGDGGQQVAEFLIGGQLRVVGPDLVRALEQEARLAGLDHAKIIVAVSASDGIITDGL